MTQVSEPQYIERFQRQIDFLSQFESKELSRYDLQEKLKTAQVVILGVGGVGSWAALTLAGAGVGKLTLVDFDRVELSNLNRLPFFSPTDVGEKKTAVLSRHLQEFRPDMEIDTCNLKVTSADSLSEVIAGDFVIASMDQPPSQITEWVEVACQRTKTAHIFSGSLLGASVVGPLVRPGVSACIYCDRSNEWHDVTPRRKTPSDSQMAMAQGGIAAMQAVMFLIGEMEPLFEDRASVIDLTLHQFGRIEMPRNPACPVCSQTPAGEEPLDKGQDGGPTTNWNSRI